MVYDQHVAYGTTCVEEWAAAAIKDLQLARGQFGCLTPTKLMLKVQSFRRIG